jgi:ER lumen protein retaining receptor
MNAFRLAGDMSHLLSFIVLIWQLVKSKSANGISLKTQELYLLVFLCRYIDLFTNFYSLYNTVFKIFYITCSAAIVCMIRFKNPWKQTNHRQQDTFNYLYAIVPCFVLALLFNYEFTVMEILWTFSIYLEAIAIFPQLFVLHRTKSIENFTAHYVFFLGSYRALYILNWIYRYFTEYYYRQWLVWISGVVQTALYCDFFFHYVAAKKEGFDKPVILPS